MIFIFKVKVFWNPSINIFLYFVLKLKYLRVQIFTLAFVISTPLVVAFATENSSAPATSIR